MSALSSLALVLALLQAPDARPSRVTTIRPPDPVSVPSGLDVLVIVGDDFNWLDLLTAQAPNITALANQGLTFRHGYVFPLCSITRYSLLFGRYPRRDNIGTVVPPSPPGPNNPSPTMGLPTL